MHIEFFLEEPSAETFIDTLAPKLFKAGVTHRCHPYGGKKDLLQNLPNRLKGLKWIPEDWRIVVLVDEDREDCAALKATLEKFAKDAGFNTKSRPGKNGRFVVLNRIAVEELEAWYFGDPSAIQKAYPRFKPSHARQNDLRNPDGCKGGTWEAFERALQEAGYYSTGLPKKEAAAFMAAHMEPARNTSPSFKAFWDGLRAL
ncbi:MAG: DUF4276 family protein [Flavobacteriales bacterium]|nr:DUF4276 family protein [Flavobacteriales bacterium]